MDSTPGFVDLEVWRSDRDPEEVLMVSRCTVSKHQGVVPLAAVDSLEVKRMGLTGVMEISAGGGLVQARGQARRHEGARRGLRARDGHSLSHLATEPSCCPPSMS